MARIRTIKPEFPQSESMGRVSREARLLFVLLWTVVDDEGRTRAASRMLASLLYPYDDDAKTHIVQWLFELEREGCVRLYDVDGNAYLQIEKWLSHQKIDRPSASRLPAPHANAREPSRVLAADLVPSILDLVPKNMSDKSDVPKAEIQKNQYPEGFQAFWKAYPTDPNMAKKPAFAQWRRLSPEDHLAATASITAFKAYCSKNPTYRPVHAERFLRERRFDGFNQAVATSGIFEAASENGWRNRLRVFRESGGWPPKWGPDPSKPDCKCPPNILKEAA